MNICANIITNVEIGEVVVIKKDRAGVLGLYLIGGEMVGTVLGRQPDGCVDFWSIAAASSDNRILAKVSIKCGKIVFLNTDSKALSRPPVLERFELEGYGMPVIR